jgi:hypothetical protein
MKMCAISNAIREKPRWWEKIKNPEIVAKWRKEILEHEHDGKVGSQEKVPGDRNDAHDNGEDEEKEGERGERERKNPDMLEELRKITEGMVRMACVFHSVFLTNLRVKFDYIVGELEGYAALRDEATGIEV